MLLAVGGALVSMFSGYLDPSWQEVGFIAGIVLCLLGVLGTVWHVVNNVRESRGRPRLMLDPIHVIAFGLLIVLVGIGWQAFRSTVPPSQLATLQNQLKDLQANFDALVKPRTISEEQEKTLVDYLLPRDHGSIRIVFEDLDSEASKYASILNKAIERGGWQISRMSPNATPLPEGVHIHTWIKRGEKKPHGADLLQQAFLEASIPLMGTGSGGGEETVVELRVGPKPRTLPKTRSVFINPNAADAIR